MTSAQKAKGFMPYCINGIAYNSKGEQISEEAFLAIKAAILRYTNGSWMARRFYQNRTATGSLSLYRLACQLLAVSIAEQ